MAEGANHPNSHIYLVLCLHLFFDACSTSTMQLAHLTFLSYTDRLILSSVTETFRRVHGQDGSRCLSMLPYERSNTIHDFKSPPVRQSKCPGTLVGRHMVGHLPKYVRVRCVLHQTAQYLQVPCPAMKGACDDQCRHRTSATNSDAQSPSRL